MKNITISVKNTLDFQMKINDKVCNFLIKKVKNNWVISSKDYEVKITLELENNLSSKEIKELSKSSIKMIIDNEKENISKTGNILQIKESSEKNND